MAGEEAVVPPAAQRMAEFGASVAAVAHVLEAPDRARIERELTECAGLARSEVLERYMEGRPPTPEECHEKGNFGGRYRTRAMFLGEEMHRVALACAESRLKVLRPGGFSVEPRYTYNQQTRKWEFMSAEKEAMLLDEGCFGELRGTIKPDIVIHSGNPLLAQAVYDFKFPCVRIYEGHWCKYTNGPHQGLMQDAVYYDALLVKPLRILPRIGVMP
ncbi:hypothetical protein [Melittangium boletus]|nr:hypothetical protein [Melittangium boletus]